MKENADFAIQGVLRSEGGYSNHPDDKGGPTNKGITLATARRYISPKFTIEQLKVLTNQQATDIYRQQYWNAVRADELPSGVDYVVFDCAVMSGPSQAIKFLQTALRVPVDGKLGPVTLEAANAVHPAQLVSDLSVVRLNFYSKLSNFATFGKGWKSRVDKVQAEALGLIKTKPVATQPNLLGRILLWLFGRKN